MADDYRQRRQDGPANPAKARRKGAVEVFMMTFNFFVSVYLGCVFVARTPHLEGLLWASLAGLAAGAALALLRWQVPAKAESRTEEDDESDEQGDEGGWDVSSAVMAAIVIPVVMLIGFLLHGWLLVLIVMTFALTVSDPSAFHVVIALACSIALSAAAEFAIVHPLYKRWDIALD